MSRAVHLIVPGYFPTEGRCLPSLGVSGRAATLSPCYSNFGRRFYSGVQVGSVICASRAAYVTCKASSGGHRRNSDFSRQNNRGFSRNRNRQNEERDRDSIENLEESDFFMSKNGPLLPLSSTPKFQATATPGPREREIVELFRKVQARLRERAALKDDNKVEASRGKGKENETVDSLLKLLRKHSVELGKRTKSDGDPVISNEAQQNGIYREDKSTRILNSNSKAETKGASFNRPPSNFQRRSPIPQVKFQQVYSGEDFVNSKSDLDITGEKMQPLLELESEIDEPEAEPELEPETAAEPEPERPFSIVDTFDDLSEGEASDINEIDDENEDQQVAEDEDLSSMKLTELRALAKSRGVKGYSKMKKGKLVELLRAVSV